MKKTISVVLLVTMLLAVLASPASAGDEALRDLVSFSLSVPDNGTILNVKWNHGFVGSNGNKLNYENALNTNSGSSYRYSDVITIEKAGTTIWFTEKKSSKSHYTAYVISSWEKDLFGDWAIDLTWANYQGSAGERSRICRKNSNGTCTYVYTTSKDNENIRITTCMGDKSASDMPIVYSSYTGEKGTYTLQLEQEAAEVTYKKTGVVDGVLWFKGSVGSPTRTDGETFCWEILENHENYYYSSVIHIPYAGMKLVIIDTEAPYLDSNYLSISSWTKLENGSFVCDENKPAFAGGNEDVETIKRGECTYTYVSTEDNEYIRFCFLGKSSSMMPAVIWSGYWPEETTEAETTVEENPTESEPSGETEEGTEAPEITPPASESNVDKIIGGCVLGGVTVIYGAYGMLRAMKRKESAE